MHQEQQVDICSIDNDGERNAVWNMMYFEKWGHFPSKNLQSLYEKFLNDKNFGVLVDELLNQLRKAGEKLDNITSQDILSVTSQAGKTASIGAIGKSLNYLVARETVKASIGGGVTQGGKRMAIVAIEQTATRAAAQGGAVAFKVLGSFGVGIASAVGEFAAGTIAEQFGFKDKRIENAAALLGAIGAGALAGAFVGGPVGAAAGAGVGAVSFAVGQTFGALARTGWGPADNWVYYETHDAHNMCFGSYASDDKMYWKTYCNKYPDANSKGDCFSAGQGQDRSFQVTVWEGNTTKAHHQEVFYRDLIKASRINGRLIIVHCRGGFSPYAGSTVITYKS
ncbi:unnamed protein product [Paramecium sonneborni]|uniref:Uncharacterized protein n=1 Tax=Paramecium sonneborni TaxID=65129 RepID=A0A8S1MKQ3_9CILI|nr:unnamed protein product [Paramecium sonneborni]